MASDQLFYVGQKAFIEKDGEVLTLKHGLGLDFPGGKIKEGELDFVNELKREVREETDIEIEVGVPFFVWHSRNPKDGHFIYLIGFQCKYVSGDVKLSEEHLDHQWVNKSNFKDLDDGSDYFEALRKYFER